AAENKSAASFPVLSAVARCPAWDSAARSAHTISPTAPPAPSLPRTLPAESSSCTARIPSSSPVSSACATSSCWHDFIYTPCGKGGLNQSLPKTNTARTIINSVIRLEKRVWKVAQLRDADAFAELVPADAVMIFQSGIVSQPEYLATMNQRRISRYEIRNIRGYMPNAK